MVDNNNNITASAAADAATAALFSATSLYVGDLDPDVTEAQLIEKFGQFGSVMLVRICRDKITRQSLGYAYVNFSQPFEAERALDTLNFEMLNGRPMRIMWSQRDPSLRRSGIGNVFIKNLDKSIDNKSLYDTFSTFGNILSCKIMSDENGSKGYGFVHFETQEAAENAIKNVNNKLLNGRIVYVRNFMSKYSRLANTDTPQAKFTNLYVKNFDDSVDEAKLNELFSKYGEVTSVKIARDAGGKSIGFGFVNFSNPDDAAKALANLHESDLNGKQLYVSKFEKKSERLQNLRKQYEKRKLEILKKYEGVNLFVKNLDDQIDSERLKKEFSQFGQIISAIVKMENGQSKGFGFICFSTSEEANRAIAEMNGRILGKKPLYVALAQRKEDRRKILAASFRERFQNSIMLLQQQQHQSQQPSFNQAAHNLYFPYQDVHQQARAAYMPAGSSAPNFDGVANMFPHASFGAGGAQFQRSIAVPRWSHQLNSAAYQHQPQRMHVQHQQQPYYMQQQQQQHMEANVRNFNKSMPHFFGLISK